ncbi:rRNA biogenesis protein rrp36 [Naganishia albida]|nr:rRNA biogenesis protein rrp36 [Naganishia albida]
MAKHTSKRPLPMPHDSDDSEIDEFAAERRQRGMYDDSESDAPSETYDSRDDDDDDDNSDGWQPDEIDGEEEEFTDVSEDEAGSEEDAPRGKSDKERLASLRKNLEQVPLAELLKAQRKLAAKQHTSDSESDAPSASASTTSQNRLEKIKRQLLLMQQKKGKALAVPVPHVAEDEYSDDGEQGQAPAADGGRNSLWDARNARKEDRAREREWEEKRAAEREKRKREGKHAPMVMSAKKPVTRRRQVVELEKTERRDPRFGSLSAGVQDPNLTAQSYSFVSGMMSDEYNTLKSALREALKRERSAPWAEQAQRVAEREEIEVRLHRARSAYERYQREQREKKVLQEVKKEERAKQAEGKGEWHMKRADKKDLLLKARFQALEQEGGKRKVKKAIEKKQKKIAGKEKKSRPFARGQGGAGGGGGGDGGERKRRRVG